MTEVPPMSQPVREAAPGRSAMVAGLILGIASIAVGWLIPLAGFICGLVGVILSPSGMSKARAAGHPTGVGVWGLVLSIIGLIWSILWWIGYGMVYFQATQR